MSKKEKAAKPEEQVTPEQDKAAELEAQLNETKDSMLRLMAEYDNYRKRSQREKEAAYTDSKIDVIAEILPVLDNFERAAMNEDAEAEDYKKGIKMIFSQFDNVLKKLGVETFGEKGEEFDPNMHNAVMHIDSDELGENVIAEVFATGYKIGERVVRHATVQVAN